ncbi:hypothetical protein MMC07_000541 [Pseudocyphellaria aurata]|nr:hypothetical protein [Pseudocyphellaria aurata]
MTSEATPRINAKYLDAFANRTVRILGKVVTLRGESAVVEANGAIVVHLNRDAHLTLHNAVELVGKVQPDLSIKVFQATDFGDKIVSTTPSQSLKVSGVAAQLALQLTLVLSLDFAAVEALVDATHRYKEIFYESAE